MLKIDRITMSPKTVCVYWPKEETQQLKDFLVLTNNVFSEYLIKHPFEINNWDSTERGTGLVGWNCWPITHLKAIELYNKMYDSI